jgi:hypothetical protein
VIVCFHKPCLLLYYKYRYPSPSIISCKDGRIPDSAATKIFHFPTKKYGPARWNPERIWRRERCHRLAMSYGTLFSSISFHLLFLSPSYHPFSSYPPVTSHIIYIHCTSHVHAFTLKMPYPALLLLFLPTLLPSPLSLPPSPSHPHVQLTH